MLNTQENLVIRNLGDGLILRRSTPADAEKLSEFNSMIHGDDGPDERIGWWTRDLLEKPHPTFGAGDFSIVEEQTSGRIISSLNLISQTWSYASIPFGVGRPELVGTLPEFRNRGLVRTQFDEVHRWSAERGEMAQAITGIPFYYRLFGYEMCVDLEGSRSGFEMNLPKLAENSAEAYRFRPATPSDIPFISAVYEHAAKRSLLYTLRDRGLWDLELNGRSEKSVQRLEWEIIERVTDNDPVGFLAHPWFSWGVSCPAQMFELKAGVSWLEVTPAVVRHLWELGRTVCESEGKTRSAFTFALTGSHPAYEVMRDSLPRVREPYCWYMRVADLPGFLKHIAPVLEERIEASLIPGYSGEVKISFYKNGLRLVFERGKLILCEAWQPDAKNWGNVSFPNQTFLQLLFGHRSLAEIENSYADCGIWSGDGPRILLNTLFPKKPSHVMGIA
jgi:hypothetical protein